MNIDKGSKTPLTVAELMALLAPLQPRLLYGTNVSSGPGTITRGNQAEDDPQPIPYALAPDQPQNRRIQAAYATSGAKQAQVAGKD